MLFPSLLNQYIIRTEIKINQCNFKTYCKLCIEELEEEEGSKIFFPNKRDRIIQHFKKCPNFTTKTTAKEHMEIFKLLELTSIILNKRLCKYSINIIYIIFLESIY